MLFVLLFVLACRPPDDGDTTENGSVPAPRPVPSETMPTASPTATTGSTGQTAATADTGPTVPMIDEALSGRCMPAFTASPPDPTLHRVTLADARCNDGTPARMFVRPSPTGSNDWVIAFDGGSRCGSGEACAARWCGEDAYDATKMSSRWSPLSRGAEGLQGTDPTSAFADHNHVLVTYCTSDMWVGTRSDVVLTTDDGTDYRVHFEGALVVDAVWSALRAGATSDDGLVVLPSLDDASSVLIAGSSAGGMAVTQHADALAATLPQVPMVAVVDAMVTPDPADTYADGFAEAWAVELRRQVDEEVDPLYAGRLHSGCLAERSADPWRCWEPSLVQLDHVQLPLFVHHDLSDRVLSDSYLALGATLPGYINASKQLLERLAASRPEVAVHGPRCGTHTTLGDGRTFGLQQVRGLSMHDALVAWMSGVRVVAVDEGAGLQSDCAR